MIRNTITKENFGKQKFDYPKLEDLNPNVTYALTISPAPVYQKNSMFENYEFLRALLKDNFDGLCQYTLRPEISTKSTHFHVHGDIKFTSSNNIFKFYAFKIKNLKDFCTFTIKPIMKTDPIESIQWCLYCLKQRHIIKPYLTETYNNKKINLPYKITNLNAPPIRDY